MGSNGPTERELRQRILQVRDQQVMLGSDLAELYGVETRALNFPVPSNAT